MPARAASRSNLQKIRRAPLLLSCAIFNGPLHGAAIVLFLRQCLLYVSHQLLVVRRHF